ncbi:hypothetical protein J6590_010311 [Homalodisca vitripennis]|nr:hypothetical protein J6590_010311 [Homalodisca vitripennis]
MNGMSLEKTEMEPVNKILLDQLVQRDGCDAGRYINRYEEREDVTGSQYVSAHAAPGAITHTKADCARTSRSHISDLSLHSQSRTIDCPCLIVCVMDSVKRGARPVYFVQGNLSFSHQFIRNDAMYETCAH